MVVENFAFPLQPQLSVLMISEHFPLKLQFILHVSLTPPLAALLQGADCFVLGASIKDNRLCIYQKKYSLTITF